MQQEPISHSLCKVHKLFMFAMLLHGTPPIHSGADRTPAPTALASKTTSKTTLRGAYTLLRPCRTPRWLTWRGQLQPGQAAQAAVQPTHGRLAILREQLQAAAAEVAKLQDEAVVLVQGDRVATHMIKTSLAAHGHRSNSVARGQQQKLQSVRVCLITQGGGHQ